MHIVVTIAVALRIHLYERLPRLRESPIADRRLHAGTDSRAPALANGGGDEPRRCLPCGSGVAKTVVGGLIETPVGDKGMGSSSRALIGAIA
ncbi:hypothetical protein GCM10020221_20630 [Streptomyces thioluteus]|uniref:Uncharacterized protein n=1 Tax=Streptomyces thioluteus TaxID=66431 RepID=A0ABN3WRN4_STRTU